MADQLPGSIRSADPHSWMRRIFWAGAAAVLSLATACAPIQTANAPAALMFDPSAAEPVNVAGGVFFNQSCPRSHSIYTVPAGKLLVIEDASALAVSSASASTPGDPGIVANVPIIMSLRTNPTGTIPFGSADHVILGDVGIPISGGRAMQAYAAPGTNVMFLLQLCTVPVNANVYFSGYLVDYP
jgi:hypothetical protein